MRALLLILLLATTARCTRAAKLSWPNVALAERSGNVVTATIEKAPAGVRCLRVMHLGGSHLGFADTNDSADRPMIDVPVHENAAHFRLGCNIHQAFLGFKAFDTECGNLTTESRPLFQAFPTPGSDAGTSGAGGAPPGVAAGAGGNG